MKELREVKSPEQLKAFTDRWAGVFHLRHSGKSKTLDSKAPGARRLRLSLRKYENVKNGTYDPLKAFWCIEKLRGAGHCQHTTEFNCEGMNIMLPMPLIDYEEPAKHFGVGTDLILIQMNGGLERYHQAVEEDVTEDWPTVVKEHGLTPGNDLLLTLSCGHQASINWPHNVEAPPLGTYVGARQYCSECDT